MLPLVSQQQGKAVWWQVPAPQFLFGLAASLSEADTLARFAAATDATLAALSAGPAAAAEMRSSAGQLVRAAAGSPHVIATVLHEIRACQPHACALRASTKKRAQAQPLPPPCSVYAVLPVFSSIHIAASARLTLSPAGSASHPSKTLLPGSAAQNVRTCGSTHAREAFWGACDLARTRKAKE